MTMNVGTPVRVKSWHTIYNITEESHRGLRVVPGIEMKFIVNVMRAFCNVTTHITVVTTSDKRTVYKIKGCYYWWHEDWLHDLTKNILPDELFRI